MDTQPVDVSAIEALGFRVEITNHGHRAYTITGKRGARYTLWRNANRPHDLFLVNSRGRQISHPTLGSWLSDKDGRLRRLR